MKIVNICIALSIFVFAVLRLLDYMQFKKRINANPRSIEKLENDKWGAKAMLKKAARERIASYLFFLAPFVAAVIYFDKPHVVSAFIMACIFCLPPGFLLFLDSSRIRKNSIRVISEQKNPNTGL